MDEKRETPEEQKKRKKRISAEENAWLKKTLSPYRGGIFFLAVLTVSGSVLSVAFSYLVRYLVDGASSGSRRTLLFFSAVLVGILLLRIGVRSYHYYLKEKYRTKISARLRQDLFSKILRSEYASLEKYHSGDLLTRLTADVSEVASDTVRIAPSVAGMLVQGAAAIAALLSLDPLFTAIFAAGAAAVGGASILLRKKMKRYHKELAEADGNSRSFIQESLSSSLTLKAYGAEEKTAEKSGKLLDIYCEKQMRRNRLSAGTGAAFSLMSNLGFVFAVVWCGVRILQGTSEFGALFSTVLLLGQLQYPLTSFSAVMPVYYARAASAARLMEADKLPEEKKETAAVPDYETLSEISFENLSFSYGRGEIFSGAEGSVEKGTIVCITGGSGTGKSTLFKLLLSVYTPTGGKILLRFCGQEGDFLRPLEKSDRALFAYVPQGNFLLSGTLRENLAFFSPETDKAALESKIRVALKTACAEFVFDLPDGLDTLLEERGGGLSEGQLQRLAVARALLSERPVLLLDEATSALDGETEKRLLENLGREEGKTCLIVTHRPAALHIADKILRIRDGKILELLPVSAEA